MASTWVKTATGLKLRIWQFRCTIVRPRVGRNPRPGTRLNPTGNMSRTSNLAKSCANASTSSNNEKTAYLSMPFSFLWPGVCPLSGFSHSFPIRARVLPVILRIISHYSLQTGSSREAYLGPHSTGAGVCPDPAIGSQNGQLVQFNYLIAQGSSRSPCCWGSSSPAVFCWAGWYLVCCSCVSNCKIAP